MNPDDIRAALALLERAALNASKPPEPAVVVAGGVTVGEIQAQHWETHARHLRSGKSGVRSRWAALAPFWRHRPAASVTKAMAEEYRDLRKTQKTRRSKPPTVQTINNELAVLRAMLSWATEQRPPLIPYNPLAGLKLEEAGNVRQTKIAREVELEMLLSCCSPMLTAMVLALIDSGMRRLEVMRLRWDQIDMGTRFVRLPGSRTKNKKPRKPRLTVRSIEAINKLPRVCDYVFANPKRKRPFNPRHLYRLYLRAVAASGLRGVEGESIVLHTLRHSFAYKARVKWKWSERATMAQAGWTTRASFDRYGISDDEEIVAASELAEEAIARERAGMYIQGARRGPKRAEQAEVATVATQATVDK